MLSPVPEAGGFVAVAVPQEEEAEADVGWEQGRFGEFEAVEDEV